MKLTMIGTGYVGLVSGTCFAQWGVDVTCVDKDSNKISRLIDGEIPIYEPDLERMVVDNYQAGRLHFTSRLEDAVRESELIFIAVGTPTDTGNQRSADLSAVFAVAETIAPHLPKGAVVVTKSTVPVGTAQKVHEHIAKHCPHDQFSVASNPEFLREGSAVQDFMQPDRVIIGTTNAHATTLLQDLYRPLDQDRIPVFVTDTASAELAKYAANAFLATKVAFINEIADLCEKTGANIEDVATGMGLDERIGHKFLQTGPGYGGSCFPKDTHALAAMGTEHASPCTIVQTVITSNEARKSAMADKIIAASGGSVKGKRITLWGLTFKANTDDMRDAASLAIVPRLLEAGAILTAHDPEGLEQAKALLPAGINYQDGQPLAAAEGADMLVILTEWSHYTAISLDKLKQTLATPTIVDLRNLYNPATMRERGFTYHSLGRP